MREFTRLHSNEVTLCCGVDSQTFVGQSVINVGFYVGSTRANLELVVERYVQLRVSELYCNESNC